MRKTVVACVLVAVVAMCVYWSWPLKPRRTILLEEPAMHFQVCADGRYLAILLGRTEFHDSPVQLRMWDLTTGTERPTPFGI